MCILRELHEQDILNGLIFGLFMVLLAKRVKDKGVMVVLILGSLFACYGLAQFFNLDELLSTMTLGCLAANSGKEEDKFFISVREDFEEFILSSDVVFIHSSNLSFIKPEVSFSEKASSGCV